ncbi:MAG: hypothetical protein JW772_01710 [Candidatus Diapherotrites archaeon]|nr:hypothetical protein [Candidatus Diapherotrites archaeon]
MVIIKGSELAKALPQEKLKELGFSPESDFDVNPVKPGVWVFSEKKIEKSANAEVDAKIFKLLGEKSLSEKVEGKFEKLLNKTEQKRFKELLEEGKIFPFKLSDKYKKPIYKVSYSQRKETETHGTEKKPLKEYSLEKDGIMVCTTKAEATMASMRLQDAIKKGEIQGIKSFDSNYYIIENSLLEKYRQLVAGTIASQKTISLNEIAEKTNISVILAKIVCEFLKEDGEIIEKKEGLFQYV